MSYRVAFLPEAEEDLDDIEDYLSQFGAFEDFVAVLEDRIHALKEWPLMCPAYELDSYFRRMVIGDYQLFYSADEKRQLVVIHCIVHQKRDVSRIISTRRSRE